MDRHFEMLAWEPLRNRSLSAVRGRDHGDAAAVEDHDVVGDVEHQLGALLDQHDREAAFLQLADGGHHFCDDLRREAFGGLVHQQDARIVHQRPADRQHLLLAAREIAGGLAVPFFQAREHREHRLSGPSGRTAVGRVTRCHRQVLAHCEAAEDAAPPAAPGATPSAAICSGGSLLTGVPNTLDFPSARKAAGRR